jgi:hypothetical protein
MDRLNVRFWLSAAFAALNAGVLALTVVTPDWIEAAFHVDPDGGNGAVEWLVVAGTAIFTMAALALAAAEWRRGRSVG